MLNGKKEILKNQRLINYTFTFCYNDYSYICGWYSKLNPNVVVFENAVNHKEFQWIPRKTESDRIRFIWGGGYYT